MRTSKKGTGESSRRQTSLMKMAMVGIRKCKESGAGVAKFHFINSSGT